MPELARLQAVLQAAIVAPTAEGWSEAGSLLAASAMTPQRRLSLYARGYQARLMECLRGEFPALRVLVGDPVFDLFASGYLAAHPSRAASLHRLGEAFPDWLEATRPCGDPDPLTALPADLARLERVWSQALRAAGPEGMRPPPDDLMLRPGVRVRMPATTTLLTTEFDLAPLMTAVLEGREPPTPDPGQRMIAVARNRYRVRLNELTPARHHWLAALGYEGGEGLGAARKAAAAAGLPDAAVLADLTLWAPLAIEAGLVVEG
ncbi:MAG: DNA-binding domain-containing protein [Alphaproteobacteria bacterium]|nr:DNA-binding domain-containing protein [Alphaproteobacteria bacterium]